MRIKLEHSLEISEIIKATSALSADHTSGIIDHISTNSKECCNGDLFFALNGEKYTENEFLGEAISRGAIPITTRTDYYGIHVKNTRHALLDLSEYYLSRLEHLKETICITGSVGKTTTKEFIKVLLSDKYVTHATQQNNNNEIGVPLTILSSPYDCEVLILELGTNHKGEIANLSTHVHPSLSIITNIGTSHIGNFGSKEDIAKEKADILLGMEKQCLICEYGEELMNNIITKRTVSCESPYADFFLLPIKEEITGSTFDFFCDKGVLKNVRFNIAGRHMLNTLAMAVSTAFTVGVSEKEIVDAIKNIREDSVRHRLIKMNDYYILDDSYNASRESVFADITLMSYYKNHRATALLGDILELGDETERIHREIGAYAYKSGMKQLYLFGAYSKYTMMGAIDAGMSKTQIHINTNIDDPHSTAEDIINNHVGGDIILFKASHKINLGRIIEILRNKERKHNA